jgi:hypothetical protein
MAPRPRCGLMVVAACVSASSAGGAEHLAPKSEAGNPSAGSARENEKFIRIGSPRSGTTVADFIDLALSFRDFSLVNGGFTLWVDGTLVGESPYLGLSIRFDTSVYPNGPHELKVSCKDRDGNVYGDAVTLAFKNAPFKASMFWADKPFYQNGRTVEINAEYTGDTRGLTLKADFSQIDSGFSPGNVGVTDLTGGRYLIKYTISKGNVLADGVDMVVTVVATDGASKIAVDRPVKVSLRNKPPAPYQFSDDLGTATFVDRVMPKDAMDPSTRVTPVSGSLQSIIPGVPLKIVLAWKSDVTVENLYITLDGYAGYYILPVTAGKTGQVTVTALLPTTFASQGTMPGKKSP